MARHATGVTIEAFSTAVAVPGEIPENGRRPAASSPSPHPSSPPARIDVSFLAADIVRVRMVPPHARHPGSPRSYAVLPALAPTTPVVESGANPTASGAHPSQSPARSAGHPPPVTVHEDARCITLSTTALAVTVDKNPVRFSYARADGSPILADSHPVGMAWRRGQVLAHHVLAGDHAFFGLGEKTGFLDLSGRRYTMWNTDISPHLPDTDPLYAAIPFFIGHHAGKAFGVFLDNTFRTHFDMNRDRDGTITLQADAGHLDLYFFAGPDLPAVVRRYTDLTGRMPMPPLWALGYHQCRYSYKSAEEVLEVARTFRERGLPCDALYLDIHYMDDYRVFTFHPDRFPNPRGLTDELHRHGFRTVTIVDPGIKVDPDYPPYAEGTKAGFWATRPDGSPYVGEVWPGKTVFPDFTRPEVRSWWARWHRTLFEAGVDGIWNDMNEPADFAGPDKTLPPDVEFGPPGSPLSHAEIHNVYGNLMAEATREAYAAMRPDERPFIISRAGYAGIQRHAVMWTGDNSSWWEHLLMSIPMSLNLSLSGVPFVGADIGGFLGDCDGELLTRWTQLGTFMPLFRNHSVLGSRPQEPYRFGEPYESICRRYLTFRYRLLPYMYTLVQEASLSGTPVIRPLPWEFPGDPKALRLYDQFMLGPSLMVAPVCGPGLDHRSVYFPPGSWINVWTGETMEGRKAVTVEASLDTIPLFLREGGIVPYGIPMIHTGEKPQRLDLVDVHGRAPGQFSVYIDDGHSLAYRRGEAAWLDITHDVGPEGSTVTLQRRGHDAPAFRWPVGTVRLGGLRSRPKVVSSSGIPLDPLPQPDAVTGGNRGWAYDADRGRLYVGVHAANPRDVVEVRF